MAARGKYTDAIISTIAHALELGASYRRAAAAAGISEDTFHEWRRAKPAFSERIEKAEATHAQKHLAVIERAAVTDGTWQASAWMLERRYPHEYGRTVQEQQGQQKILIEYANDWRTSTGGGAA